MMNSFMLVYSYDSLKLFNTSTVHMNIWQATISLRNYMFTFLRFIFYLFISKSCSIEDCICKIYPVLEFKMWMIFEYPVWKLDVRTTDFNSSFLRKWEWIIFDKSMLVTVSAYKMRKSSLTRFLNWTYLTASPKDLSYPGFT